MDGVNETVAIGKKMATRKLRDSVRGVVRQLLQRRLCVVIANRVHSRQAGALGERDDVRGRCGTELLGDSVGSRKESAAEVHRTGSNEIKICGVAAAGFRPLPCLAMG